MENGKNLRKEEEASLGALVDERISRSRRALNRQVWLMTLFFLVLYGLLAALMVVFVPPEVLESVQNLSPNPPEKNDFLKALVPILVVAFGFLVGLLGLKRLEQFDQEIDNLRRYLSKQLSDERRLALDERQGFRSDVQGRLDEFKGLIQSIAEQHVSDAHDLRVKELEESFEEFSSRKENVVLAIEQKLQPYKWLEERKEEIDALVGIHTIGAAHREVTRLQNEGKIDLALRISEYAIDKRLPGEPDDYHNLSAQLAQNEQFPLAARTSELGLEFYGKDVDLIADSIKYRSATGDLEIAARHYAKLKKVPKTLWNWRAFVFSGDYLQRIGKIKEAMSIYESFQESIPMDERGYSMPGTYYNQLGDYSAAIAILEEGLRNCPRAAQTALVLCQAYTEIGEYEKAIHASKRGVESTATPQPSANTAALMWYQAAAYDSWAHRIVATKTGEDPSWKIDGPTLALVKEAVTTYQTALSLRMTLGFFGPIGGERIKLLRTLATRNGASDYVIESIFGGVEEENAMDPSSFLEQLLSLKNSSMELGLEPPEG